MKKIQGMEKPVRYSTLFYIRKFKITERTEEELKIHVVIDDIKKLFRESVSDISFLRTEFNNDDSYSISSFSANKEREIKFFFYKKIMRVFCDLQIKHEKDDVITDHIPNTTLLSEEKKEAYEKLNVVFKKDGMDIEEFFEKRKDVLIRFLQGDDSKIE